MAHLPVWAYTTVVAGMAMNLGQTGPIQGVHHPRCNERCDGDLHWLAGEPCPDCGGEGRWAHVFDDNGPEPGKAAVVECATCEGSGRP